jgi:hypothetical protein
MSTFIVRALCLALALSLAACASELDESTSPALCDLNPELGATPRALVRNGIQTNGSIHVNRLAANGVQTNGIQVNGLELNGIRTNRLAANGVENNSVERQGIALNGFALNGFVLNGHALDGLGLNGQSPKGVGLNANRAMNELVAIGHDGQVVAGEGFVGATIGAVLSDGKTIDVAITAFERSATEPDIALYELAYAGQSLCADGQKGMFLPGVWDERGAHHDSLTTGEHTASLTYSCLGGVIAKCARWGYGPWRVGAALHQTCTRMARADYCGTGVSFTRDGTPIDLFDVQGVQQPAGDAEFLFEAGWGENGATCVNRPRYDARTASGDAVLPSCWRDLPKCSSFDDAKQRGATIGNASRPQSRRICK